MHSKATIARAFASAFLAGEFEVDAIVDRGVQLLGQKWTWLRPLASRLCVAFEAGPRPRRITVVKFLLEDVGFQRAYQKYELRLPGRLATRGTMNPIVGAASWNVPPIQTAGKLAEWLGITVGELEWFADCKQLEYKRNQGRLRHYHYRTLAKRFGQVRLIEAPKPRLKEIQRRVLTGVIERIPVHAAAHGFRRGRSIKTFATPHVGQAVVARLDLQDFFPSISAARIQALFRTVGYPDAVATQLTGICTNAAPLDVWDELLMWPATDRLTNIPFLYAQPHLPQGAPTSPALANLCAYRLDCRLSGLAAAAGATYTRYADDLAFSGDAAFSRVAKRFCLHACAIVLEEGFRVHHRKTRIMRAGVRQRLAGLLVNERLNVSRSEFDQLKATLTNCARHGADGQNRGAREDFRAHLLGRISFVAMLNPARGDRLRAIFDRIEWQ
ncbi:MAG TPA: reverse transcriptase family protein [Pirellulales bacterium]